MNRFVDGDQVVGGHGVDGERAADRLADGFDEGGKGGGCAVAGRADVAALRPTGLVPDAEAQGVVDNAFKARVGREVHAVVGVCGQQQSIACAECSGVFCPGRAAVGRIPELAVGIDASDGHALNSAGIHIAHATQQAGNGIASGAACRSR